MSSSGTTVSVHETMQAINEACRRQGGKYEQYSCQVVSWDDVSRGTVGGSLSCWGANITDTYLKSKDGTQLFTVRPNNWNEKLGRTSLADVAVVAGSHIPGGGALVPQTLRNFLQNLGAYGSYAGLVPGTDLLKEDLDKECSIRFQTTFLPVSRDRGTLEFVTESYNYNTLSDSDPRNLVLLCTSQGVAVQQDGKGAKRLFHHAVDEDSIIHRYWLEAERSSHKVGGSQRESDEERNDALDRGKATSSVIGTSAMGTRFNVLMTIQVPLQRQSRQRDRQKQETKKEKKDKKEMKCKKSKKKACAAPLREASESDDYDAGASEPQSEEARRRSRSRGTARGTANAARVSRGTEHDTWAGLSISQPIRNDSEHVTVTVVMYNTVVDGVPTEADIMAAIDDLEDLYANCGTTGQLADSTFDFMKEELTVKDAIGITSKVTTQPYQPPAVPVKDFDIFPA